MAKWQWLTGTFATIIGGYVLWYITEQPIGVNIAGSWGSTNNNVCLTLNQNHDSVSGIIKYSNGQTGNISGQLTGRTLNYQYGKANDSGSGTIVFSPNDLSASAHWKSEHSNKEGLLKLSRGCNKKKIKQGQSFP